MSRVGPRFLSEGHGERFDAVVWANVAALSVLDGGADEGDGAELVEEAILHDYRGDRPGGLLAMDRRQGTWQFSAVDANGAAVDPSRLAACATCHEQGPSRVFPVPH